MVPGGSNPRRPVFSLRLPGRMETNEGPPMSACTREALSQKSLHAVHQLRFPLFGKSSRKPLTVTLAIIIVAIGSTGCRGNRPSSKAPSVVRAMTVTAYCDCKKCCGWKRTWYGKPVYAYGSNRGKRKHVGVTASGTDAKVGTLAADTSRYPFGTMMYIPGYGYGRVEDRGGAIKGDHIDLFFKSHQEALEWGRQQRQVRVWYQ